MTINTTLEKRHLDENLKMAHVDMKTKNFEIMMLEAHSQVQAAAAATPVPSGGDTVIDEAKVTELTKCMLDFKGMVKPMHFNGASDEGKEFRDEFLNLMSFVQLDGLLERIPKLSSSDVEVLELEHQTASKLVYCLLYSLCDAVPKTIVRTVARNNGWSAWANLCRTYEPRGSAGRLHKLVELLHPTWTPASFMVDWMTWEQDLARYEIDYGSSVSEDVKCAIVAQCFPYKVKLNLRSRPSDLLED